MNKQDELFLLIKSMNKNEKGYFRKFSGIHGNTGDGVYQKLFDCMAGMKEYDEEIVRHEFKGEKMLRHLRVTKHYLRNLVVRSLRNYQEDNVPYISNLMNLADTYVMVNRGLHQAAGKRIQKEKESAKAGDNFLSALNWISLQDRLRSDAFLVTEMKERAGLTLSEKQMIAEQYVNYSGYIYLLNLVAPMIANTMGKEEMKELDIIIKHPLLSSSNKPNSKLSRFMYTDILIRIYRLKNERTKGIKLLKESIARFEDPDYSCPVNPIYLYNQLLNFQGRAEVTEMGVVLSKMKNILVDKSNTLSESWQNLYQSYYYGHEMRYYYLQGKDELVLRAANKLEQHYKKFPAGTDEEISMWLLEALAYTALKRFDKALVQLNKIFNHNSTQQKRHLLDAYLLNIIVHLELGNYSILKRQFAIAGSFIKKHFNSTQYEWQIFQDLQELVKGIQKGDRKAIRIKAINFLKNLKSKKAVDKEYLEDWLQTLTLPAAFHIRAK